METGTINTWKHRGITPFSVAYQLRRCHHRRRDEPIATGEQILEYLTDAVSTHRLADLVRFRHRVVAANWSSVDKVWTISVSSTTMTTVVCRWMILGTGYFDYDPVTPSIPGLESFKGKVINPQSWPKDFDYTHRKIAVIGSGATAVAMLPMLPDRAKQPNHDSTATWARRWLWFVPRVSAAVNWYCKISRIISPYLAVLLCYYMPSAVRDSMRKDVTAQLPKHVDFEIHFKPRYDPWDQRICVDLDGAFFKALHLPNVKLVTGDIEAVQENGVVISTSKVDGAPISWRGRYIWNGAMLDSVPNMMFMLGYTNHAWTLGADDSTIVLVRLLKWMKDKHFTAAVPVYRADTSTTKEFKDKDKEAKEVKETQRVWQLSSTYVRAADPDLPVYGMRGSWKPRNRPPIDYVHARWGDYLDGLVFSGE
ncbi:putative flavin-binding monooxygenase [Xylariaceae sp. FL0255]|nr:putative flavin-binding monooxygenase [Xylariaceae sp. FL0255]